MSLLTNLSDRSLKAQYDISLLRFRSIPEIRRSEITPLTINLNSQLAMLESELDHRGIAYG